MLEIVYVARHQGIILCAFEDKNDVKDYLRTNHLDKDPYDVDISLYSLTEYNPSNVMQEYR